MFLIVSNCYSVVRLLSSKCEIKLRSSTPVCLCERAVLCRTPMNEGSNRRRRTLLCVKGSSATAGARAEWCRARGAVAVASTDFAIDLVVQWDNVASAYLSSFRWCLLYGRYGSKLYRPFSINSEHNCKTRHGRNNRMSLNISASVFRFSVNQQSIFVYIR